jgi:FkbH-like protein
MAVASEHSWTLAGFYVRHLRPLCGLSKKVLMLDADNTLWGGVIGDVGLDGIALGPDYPGNAFMAFQKKVLDLHRRGIVLCLNTKNEPGSVEEVFDHYPAMVLQRKHFAATRVNWKPKHENLVEMAAELNLGIDSFVFIDDSPVECDMMRKAFPDVMTICAPNEPAALPGLIDSLDCFDQFQISDEDRARGQMYQAESSRRELQAGAVDLPNFYRQLEMSMTLAISRQADIGRAAQLTARTNQFNMHTIRYCEDDIRRFMSTTDHWVVTLALKDRFGDNGIVGLAIVRRDKKEWVLHVFLMSCRVLGRTVEQCFVKWIATAAKKSGAERLIGELALTAKNKPFAHFYESSGFVEIAPDREVCRWALDLATANCDQPDWMKVTVLDSSGCV